MSGKHQLTLKSPLGRSGLSWGAEPVEGARFTEDTDRLAELKLLEQAMAALYRHEYMKKMLQPPPADHWSMVDTDGKTVTEDTDPE